MFKWIGYGAALAALLGFGVAHCATPKLDDQPGRTQALAWLKAQGKPAGLANATKMLSGGIDASIAAQSCMAMTFGPGAMKSGKPTEVWFLMGEFHAVELPARQFQQLGLKPNEMQLTPCRHPVKISPLPIAEVSDLKIDRVLDEKGKKSFFASMHCKTLRKSTDKTWLSAYFHRGGAFTVAVYRPETELPKEGRIHFAYSIDDIKVRPGVPEIPATDALVVFFALTSNALSEEVAYSNPVGTVIDFSAK